MRILSFVRDTYLQEKRDKKPFKLLIPSFSSQIGIRSNGPTNQVDKSHHSLGETQLKPDKARMDYLNTGPIGIPRLQHILVTTASVPKF